jgi:hypothetical protein
MNYYSTAKASYGPKAKDPHLRNQMLEGICETGEIFYVPSGWWHLVVNLEPSIAVTQNFVSPANLPGVLYFLKHRADQVSGFRLRRQEEEEGNSTTRQQAAEYNGGEEEDETGGGAVFARFCEALGKSDQDVLTRGLKGLARLEMEEAEQQRVRDKRKDKEGQTLWTAITASGSADCDNGKDIADDPTATSTSTGFSFGFDLGSDVEGEAEA